MKITKTKFPGVYKKELSNGDTSFLIRYKKDGKTKDSVVGKSSNGMNDLKAKQLLEQKKKDILNGVDETKIVLPDKVLTISEKMSLNQLANSYFEMWKNEINKELYKEDSAKEKKNLEGLKREISLYRSFWAEWGKSKIPFYKVSTRDFIEKIEEIQSETKLVDSFGKNVSDKNFDPEEFYFEKPKYSNKYILNALTFIQSIIKWTNCPHNPLDLSKKKKLSQVEEELLSKFQFLRKNSLPRQEYLEVDEIKTLLLTLKENPNHLQGYLICLIMATTGMRPASVLNLKYEDINFKTKKIKVFDFKRKNIYYTNLTSIVESEIKDFFKDRNPSHYIFFSDKTKGLVKLPDTPDYLGKVISKLFNKNKVGNKRIVLYTLRHSFATNLLNGSKDKMGNWVSEPLNIFEVSKLLNHASIETTVKNYLKSNEKVAIQAMNAYEESFFEL